MTPGRARLAAGLLACLLAAFGTAAAAHAVLGVFGGAYAERDHVALGPVALAAAALVAGALLRIAAAAFARAEHRDPLVAFARGARRLDPRAPLAAVFAGGLATLVAMESVEQVLQHGRLDLADALGGNVALGVAVVLAIAAVVVLGGLRCARALVDATIRTARAVVAVLLAPRAASGAAHRRTAPRRRRPAAAAVAFLARCRGLRAPPFPATIS